jgi:hypothetical protein
VSYISNDAFFLKISCNGPDCIRRNKMIYATELANQKTGFFPKLIDQWTFLRKRVVPSNQDRGGCKDSPMQHKIPYL